jgi:hypothetical protein
MTGIFLENKYTRSTAARYKLNMEMMKMGMVLRLVGTINMTLVKSKFG